MKTTIHTSTYNVPLRPAPYITRIATPGQKADAAHYRQKIVPLVRRRLKNHHLAGFRNDFIVDYIATHKKNYPFFVRTDIRLFYPNIRHGDIHKNVVIGYKQLLSAQRIPAAFERWSRRVVQPFLAGLPTDKGLPVGHSLSGILAPAMLMPLWLDIKKQFNVPFIVYMDDILLFARSASQASQLYEYLTFRLSDDYGLYTHPEKTVSGRFSHTPFDYCGWRVAGGYARVSDRKAEAFKQRFSEKVHTWRQKPLRAFIKLVNRRIDGFGNYYKHGDTGRQFVALDKWIRRQLRESLHRYYGIRHITNGRLADMGLHSLEALYRKCHGKSRTGPTVLAKASAPVWKAADGQAGMRQIEHRLETLSRQQGLMISIMRKQLLELERINNI